MLLSFVASCVWVKEGWLKRLLSAAQSEKFVGNFLGCDTNQPWLGQ